jgi:hypothetical protein
MTSVTSAAGNSTSPIIGPIAGAVGGTISV